MANPIEVLNQLSADYAARDATIDAIDIMEFACIFCGLCLEECASCGLFCRCTNGPQCEEHTTDEDRISPEEEAWMITHGIQLPMHRKEYLNEQLFLF